MQSNLGFSATPTSADFNRTIFTERTSLDAAVAEWIADEVTATEAYGDINTWDVRAITSFAGLFNNKGSFNSDIGNWDVSSGTSFYAMFKGADAFNQDIGSWDVSSSTDFGAMFAYANAFNQNISNWDVSDTATLTYMFSDADLMLSNQGFSATPTSADFNRTRFTERTSLDTAVAEWIADEDSATETYGGVYISIGFCCRIFISYPFCNCRIKRSSFCKSSAIKIC